MTKIAIPHWQGRVSPVFDVAGQALLAEVGSDGINYCGDLRLGAEDPQHRSILLGTSGVEILICGAISCPFEVAIRATGIVVISQICGDLEIVLKAYSEGRLGHRHYSMPGCYGRSCHGRNHQNGRSK